MYTLQEVDEKISVALSDYGIEITNQDIVDFMLENPSGRVRQKSSELDELGKRFSELATKAAGVKIGKPDSPTGKLFIENMRTSNNMEQLRNQIEDSRRAEEEVLRSMAEQRDAERDDDVNVSEELDYKGNPFVLNSDGGIDFGVVNQDQADNLGTDVAAPIRLSRGNEGYGFEHMKKHLDQLRHNGYDSVEEFVEDVSRNYDEIRQGNLYTDPVTGESKETFLFIKKGEKGDVLYIELSPDGTYYEVNSGGVFKNSYIEKRNLLWNASTEHSTTSGESQDFPSAQLNPESDNVSALSQNKSLSIDKDSEVSGENQEEINNVDKIRDAEREVELNPTEAQKEAGNYKKGHVRIDGFDITIENPKGSERSGTDVNGKPWSNVMNNTYGYIRGTQGVDGDHIDVFLSDSPDSGNVYVVDQIKEDGSFDEHKVMYGFDSIEDAKSAYLSNYSPDWKGLGAITEVSKDEFKKWIDSSKRKTKPFSEYKNVKKDSGEKYVPLFREVGNEYTQEEQEIIDRAKKDGSYMKAPNGNPSNLNDKQWAQVRTKAFKDWFGDWENDPQSASKVLDENGEPRVVFHGTTNDKETRVWNERSKLYDTTHEPFTVFKRKVDRENNSGHFFNSDKDNAYGYGYNTYDTYLSLQNPLVIDCKGANYSSINYNGETKDTYEWAKYAEKNGYDGVIFENVRDGVDYGDLDSPTTDYVAFKSNQIKSATDNTGEFSKENADIRFRNIEDVNRRFNEELEGLTEENSNRIRFELGNPSEFLLSAGIPNKPLVLYGNKLIKKSQKHGFNVQDIKDLPNV